MAFEHGEWVMRGLSWHDPLRIRSYKELISYINEVGFLPLFANDVPGFSAEEHVSPDFWFTGDIEQDPWEWRALIAGSGEVAYGKFISQKAAFISRKWFPVFANYRRDGYDFDARWDDELAGIRQKKIMDQFLSEPEWIGMHLKRAAGFGKDGEKNFSGILTELQMESYLVIKDFKRKVNKKGGEYGMPVCVYVRPEDLFGKELVTSGYREDPKDSKERIREHLLNLWPSMTEAQLTKILR